MSSNHLLDAGKTEFMWYASATTLTLLPQLQGTPIRVGAESISPSSLVGDLSVYSDADICQRESTLQRQLWAITALRQIQSLRLLLPPPTIRTLVVSLGLSRPPPTIRTLVVSLEFSRPPPTIRTLVVSLELSRPPPTIQTLIVSLELSRLYYGNATLAGIPAYRQRCLQSVLNAAARIIVRLPHFEYISTTLANRHCSTFFKALRRLSLSSTNSLFVCLSRLISIVDRAFPVAGTLNLPTHLHSILVHAKWEQLLL